MNMKSAILSPSDLENCNSELNCRTLTVKDIMQRLSIGKDAAYRLLHEPGFPVIKIGRIYRVREDMLNTWLLNQSGGQRYGYKARKW